jgi:hypothetical protein
MSLSFAGGCSDLLESLDCNGRAKPDETSHIAQQQLPLLLSNILKIKQLPAPEQHHL